MGRQGATTQRRNSAFPITTQVKNHSKPQSAFFGNNSQVVNGAVPSTHKHTIKQTPNGQQLQNGYGWGQLSKFPYSVS